MGVKRTQDQGKLLASDNERQHQQHEDLEEQEQVISQRSRNLNLEYRQQMSAEGQVQVGNGLGARSKWDKFPNPQSLASCDSTERDENEQDDDEHEQSASSEEDKKNRTSEVQTMMHILKANIGTGVLAMPLAFKHVGIWVGLLLLPVIGAICTHCMNILIQSCNKLCDRFNYESLDYDQVAALGLACGPKWARRMAKRASVFVTIFLMLTQIGFCCVYILFTVENLQVACKNLFGLNYSLVTYLLATFPIIWLTSCTSNLKHMARISTLANCLQLFGLSLIFFDLLQFHTYPSDIEPGAIRVEQGPAADIRNGLPIFFALAVYAFEGIGVVLPLVKEMEDPRKISGLNGVLNTTMSWVALLYMAMGFFGYAKYGQDVASSITLNLPEGTINELVRLAYALAIGLSYSLQFYVPWTMVWPVIDEALFYAYRPRKPRNKLKILSKLSAENQWAIESLLQQSDTNTTRPRDLNAGVGTTDATVSDSNDTRADQHHMLTGNSMATTLATSYSISVSTRLQPTGANPRRRHNLTSAQLQQHAHYGSMCAGQSRRPRNRMDDLLDDEQSDSEMPHVQWRPPPRSMRGKRKVVRYTIIFLSVSFTFVAAALIPRLDIFISLIGALASSCLAIIFPAIIQLCTFWNHFEDENEQQDDDEDEDQTLHEQQEGEMCLCTSTRQAELANCRHCWSVSKRRRRRDSQFRKRIVWHLFIAKNVFLVVFGILGLITGTWVSLRNLGVATV